MVLIPKVKREKLTINPIAIPRGLYRSCWDVVANKIGRIEIMQGDRIVMIPAKKENNKRRIIVFPTVCGIEIFFLVIL